MERRKGFSHHRTIFSPEDKSSLASGYQFSLMQMQNERKDGEIVDYSVVYVHIAHLNDRLIA
jgi:hypothetical protein